MNIYNECYPFKLIKLPYSYSALEPFIDEKTMEIHHSKHLKKYVDNLNNALEEYPYYQRLTIKGLIRSTCTLPYPIQDAVQNNAGGVLNHNFYFLGLANKSQKPPTGRLGCMIERTYGSFSEFKVRFKNEALKVFGSGYAVLCADNTHRLKILSTKNQSTILNLGLTPIMMIDVWEHAYYLKHQNDRAAYIDGFFNVINWEQAEENYITPL